MHQRSILAISYEAAGKSESTFFEKVSDVVESRVCFASKNLTLRIMHKNCFLVAKIDR